MPFAGRSHFGLIIGLGLFIVLVFVVAARLTRATRRERRAALAGAVVAGAVNVGTDAAAYAAGFWRYPEATTPFGPLLYYLEAGLGCAALALVARWCRRTGGRARLGWFLAGLALYAPIRDWATARTTHLIELSYQPWLVVVVADSLSSLVVPVLVVYVVVGIAERRRG